MSPSARVTVIRDGPALVAMLRMMLVGVLLFIPGWALARWEP